MTGKRLAVKTRMIPFHSLLPEIAQREVRCVHLQAVPGVTPISSLSAGEYAFVEFYCDDLECDCRRVFLQVIARHRQDKILASINYGWDDESFYRERMPHDPDAPRQIVQGSLDPINTQSEHSDEFLELFQQHVLDESYRLRLQRHYQLFREELRRRLSPSAPEDSPSADAGPTRSSVPAGTNDRIPSAHRQRFNEAAAMLDNLVRSTWMLNSRGSQSNSGNESAAARRLVACSANRRCGLRPSRTSSRA